MNVVPEVLQVFWLTILLKRVAGTVIVIAKAAIVIILNRLMLEMIRTAEAEEKKEILNEGKLLVIK